MARDRTRSVHRIPALAICLPALGLPIVRISHRRGSLIPLLVSDHREADHTIQQAVDRTIYTPHISFHRLHKPYLLHAPSVEPWTADKHRPCQSPTGQRDVMIVKTAAVMGWQIACLTFITFVHPDYHLLPKAHGMEDGVGFLYRLHSYHTHVRLADREGLTYQPAVLEENFPYRLPWLLCFWKWRGMPAPCHYHGQNPNKQECLTYTSHKLRQVSCHTGSARMTVRCNGVRTLSSRVP